MRVLLAGGTGFLGAALTSAFTTNRHEVTVLTRKPRGPGQIQWSPGEGDLSEQCIEAIERADAVINLAGESIAGRRWTAARKHALRESRTAPTRTLVRAINEARRHPPVLLNSSAIGIYGTRGEEIVTEDTPPGSDFLAEVASEWEAEAFRAQQTTRVVLLRSGIVLDARGGALPQLALPFRFFAGGSMGTGRQYMSWIHIADWVALVQWALDEQGVSGPLNLTAPEPVTNLEFARTLGRALHRPALLRVPALALRLALGEMADALVLGGQRVVPEKAQALGFTFRYPALEPALRAIYR
jgi:uncharacterized protein